jgi:hypothetical protein
MPESRQPRTSKALKSIAAQPNGAVPEASEKMYMPQRCDCAEIQARRKSEIDDQGEKPQSAHRKPQPQSSDVKIKLHKRDQRHRQNKNGQMRPLLCTRKFSDRAGPHHRDLAECDSDYRCRCHDKEEMRRTIAALPYRDDKERDRHGHTCAS